MLAEGQAEEAFEVWPENAQALNCFLAVSTQWRTGPGGGVLGLDYQGVHAALRMMRIADIRAVFEDLRTMERAALEVFAEQMRNRGRD